MNARPWVAEVDYLVVGAGAAGAVLANRLVTRGDAQVALLEAGPSDTSPAIHATDVDSMQSLWGASDWNWAFETEAQAELGGRRVAMAQGRGLGGGTSINAMMYVRGNPRDFDRWAASGAEGWGYREVLPYFQRSESYKSGQPAFRGRSGELSVIDMPTMSRAAQAFIEATRSEGWSRHVGDFNAEHHEENAALVQSTRLTPERRCSSATAFLDPIRGDGRLQLLTGVRVTRVLFEGRRAVGVVCHVDGEMREIRARREVVLSAGALWSPHILMHSGIGPADQLRTVGLEVHVELAGVGANLHDHVSAPVSYRALVELEAPQLLAEALLFCYSGVFERSANTPDLQFFFAPIRIPGEVSVAGANGFALVPILAQPRSRGTVRLASADPLQKPRIDPAYLSDPLDVEALLRGMKMARRMATNRAFEAIRGPELAPGPAAVSDHDLLAYLRGAASTVWHPVGTCKMGSANDPSAVVDPQLRVRGVEGLRVADASVIPSITSGNTNAATIMIGERAADFILSASDGSPSINGENLKEKRR